MSEYPKSKENRAKLAHAMVQLFSPGAKPDEELEDVVIEEMTKRECRTFQLSESETAKARDWEREQTKKADKSATIGGRFQYRITPTGVGLVVKVYDTLLQEEIEVTEYENW